MASRPCTHCPLRFHQSRHHQLDHGDIQPPGQASQGQRHRKLACPPAYPIPDSRALPNLRIPTYLHHSQDMRLLSLTPVVVLLVESQALKALREEGIEAVLIGVCTLPTVTLFPMPRDPNSQSPPWSPPGFASLMLHLTISTLGTPPSQRVSIPPTDQSPIHWLPQEMYRRTSVSSGDVQSQQSLRCPDIPAVTGLQSVLMTDLDLAGKLMRKNSTPTVRKAVAAYADPVVFSLRLSYTLFPPPDVSPLLSTVPSAPFVATSTRFVSMFSSLYLCSPGDPWVCVIT